MKKTEELQCDWCKISIHTQRKYDDKHRHHFCSQKCFAENARKVRPRPDANDLLFAIESGYSYVYMGKVYGVSDNTIRKWIAFAGLENIKMQGETKTFQCALCGEAVRKQACEKAMHYFCSSEHSREYERKNGKLKDYSIEDLKALVAEHGLRGTARFLDVSHSTIAKKIK